MASGGGKKDEKEKLAPIIIKRVKKGGGGHHGGAWKVAYADFVTAMMAFFLLMWLLNVTTDEQKNAISNYFDPSHPKVSEATSGAGGLLAGMTMTEEGAMVSTVQPLSQPDTSTRGERSGEKPPEDMTEEELESELRKKEDARFTEAADQLKAEIANTPDLAELQKNLLIDITPEGLRIQIVDDQGRSMFPSGSAQMYDFMRQMLLKVTGVIVPLPNQVSVRGHTDSQRYRDPRAYDNWNLSSDRAQASRRVMVTGGLPEGRIENVMGRADRDHLDTANPAGPRNRRISIILLRERLSQQALDKARAELEASRKPRPVIGGITIVDDTKPATPPAQAAPKSGTQPPPSGTPAQGQSQAPAQAPAQTGDALIRENTVQMPVTRSQTGQQGQRVIEFGTGEQAAPADGAAGGVPAVNKPPTIRTPVFRLDDNKPAQPAAPPAARTAPGAATSGTGTPGTGTPGMGTGSAPPASPVVTPPAGSGTRELIF